MKISTLLTSAAAFTLLMGTGLVFSHHPPAQVSAQANLPGSGVQVTPAYSVLGELFQTEIVNIGLERLGYDVRPGQELEYATLHVAVANGDVDFSPIHWTSLHQEFFERNGGEDQMQRLGTIVPGVLQGYLIDKATADEYDITSLDQLADPEIAALFDSNGDGQANLTGCNPGWGCELVIEHHLDAYELRDMVSHDQGRYDALMANTLTRFEQGDPILYYTWTPYWVSGVLTPGQEVEWLSVPFTDLPEAQGNLSEADTTANGINLGFAVDQQQVLVNRTFAESNPAAVRFFESVQIPLDDINIQNNLMQEGEDSVADIRRHAEEWVDNHQDLFDTWIEAALSNP